MDFTQVITQVIILFVIMGLGYYLRSKSIITQEGIKNFSALIFYVTMPAMILVAIARTQTATVQDVYDIIIAAAVAYSFLILMALIMPKVVRAPKSSLGLYRFMSLFGNVGFIGFPMLIAIVGEESLFLGALFNIPYNLFLYTLGIIFIVSDYNKGHKMKFSIKQLLNPGIMMTVIGLAIFFLGGVEAIEASDNELMIRAVNVVLDAAASLGRVTTPLAMLVVGGSLYGVKVANIYKNYRVMIFSLIRMTVFPLVVGLILAWIGLGTTVVAVAVVLVGMPIATNTVIIATQYGDNVLEASEAVFISTVMMLLTSPVLVWLTRWL